MDGNYEQAEDLVENPAPAESVKPEPAATVRRQLPQRNVDAFWKKFTTKNPGKVHSILPADVYAKTKASKAKKGVIEGQVAAKSYDQAVLECKHAVEKIAKECRRVNHKYRDPHFDIEFDLKRWRRDCLDGLGDIDDDDRHWPRSVKRVPDIFDKPEFFQGGANASDVRQGNSGDCWFLSALCALCNNKDLIDKICVHRDEVVGVYGFVFHRDGEWIQTIIDDKLYLIASDWWESSDDEKRTFEAVNRNEAEEKYRLMNQTGSKALFFAQCSSENETWLPLLEKAFAKAHGDFNAIDGGFTGEAIEDLTGGVTTELFTTDILDKDKFWSEEIMKVNKDFLFSCATGTFDKWQDSDMASRIGARNDIYRMHAYSIMEAREIKGERLLKVRNPWGEGEWRGAWSDGSDKWTPEWMQLLDHKFGDDGMFWMSYEDLLRRYSSFDRTRLFGPDWLITQQWTTIDVPWTADYNDTKFSITLKKRSPVVITLSQLDDRYFKGLEGQYIFQLHFRLEKNGEHDYIVRSHGNYSMRRSVSTDLELDPGEYSVLMKVTAQRWTFKKPVEDVIRANCKDRQNKLIQVGLSYDLAHAKGVIKETEEEKVERQKREEKKKAADRKKQREAFRKEKVKKWQRGKREKAREARQNKKREAFEKRKAEKIKAAEKTEETTKAETAAAAPIVNGTDVAAGVESEIDEQAAAGAQEAKIGEPAPDPSSMPSPPIETTSEGIRTTNGTPAEDQSKPVEPQTQTQTETPKTDPSTNATTSQLTESNLQSIPSVTINGTPFPPSNAPPSLANNAPSLAGTLAPNDDYQYESDASFDSSIDSILDLNIDADDHVSETDKDAVPDVDDSADVEADKEFEDDPWNAVCVVGLRVYSMDESCCVQIVRPKEEEDPLDPDDASKGASGEHEVEGGKGEMGGGVVQGVK